MRREPSPDRRHRLAVLVSLALGALPATVGSQTVAGNGGSPESAELEAICSHLTGGDNEYFGSGPADRLERRIDGDVDPLSAILLRGRLAQELLRLGRHEEAIQRSREAVDLAFAGSTLEDRDAFLASLYYTQGLAHLQLAEDQNCLLDHTATSCILPIRRQAVHGRPEHAQQAAAQFTKILELIPEHVQARWLLNLSRMLTGEYPQAVPAALRLPDSARFIDPGAPLWPEVGWQLGLGDRQDLSGGAIMDDFDGDGLLDLVSSSWDPCEPLKAFRNDGRGGFEDVAERWGLGGQLGGLNLSHADYDGDGRLDILVLRGAWLGETGRMRNSLLRNELPRPGRGAGTDDAGTDAGRFVDVTVASGIAYPSFPTQNAAWADYDLDGDLDLFVGNEATGTSTDPLRLFGSEGNPYPSQLFRNNGDGTFTDVARLAGVQNRRFTKGSTWGDYDQDGDPDLYVSNLGPNRLYRNNGDGTFTDVAGELAVTEPADESFPTWFFDFDNDGDLDLFVARFNTSVEAIFGTYFGLPADGGNPVLYVNEGGRFRDASRELGLTEPLLVMGSNYGDIDNDGWPDMYLGTGVPAFDALMPNVMYRNDGGTRFEDVTFEGGLGSLQKGHGVAFGDIDNDGEQEIFEQLGGAYPYDRFGNVLYDNPGSENRWLTLRLHGAGANSRAIGARVEVRAVTDGATRSIFALAGSGGSFGSSSLQVEIGLGLADRVEEIVVDWPTGRRQVFAGIELDTVYDIVEGRAEAAAVVLPLIELGGADTRPGSDHSSHPSSAADPRALPVGTPATLANRTITD